MEILKHFIREKIDTLIVYRLKSGEINKFVDELTTEFRQSYITDDELEKASKKNELSKSDFLEKYIIPDIGNIKSGDFGEMLSYFSLLENFRIKGIVLVGPHKWLWKDRNKPSQYTDAVAFHLKSKNNSSPDDLLISLESKMKATESNEHRIQDAIDGANQDRLSRLVKTLSWLEEKYARIGDIENRKLLERFGDPSQYGEYKKIYKAFAVIDHQFEGDEISRPIVSAEEIVIVVFSIDDLKIVYERNRQNMLDSVKT